MKVRVFPRPLSASGGMHTRQPQKLLPSGLRVQVAPCGPSCRFGEIGIPVRFKNECFGIRVRVAEAAPNMRAWGNGRPVALRGRCFVAYTFKSCRAHQLHNFKLFVAHERPMLIGLVDHHHVEVPEPGRRGRTVNPSCNVAPSHVQIVSSTPCR